MSSAPVRTVLEGVAGAPGMALGRARVLYPVHFEVPAEPLGPDDVAAQGARLARALASARQELVRISTHLARGLQRELGELLDAHVALLGDSEFERELLERIKREKISAEAALASQRSHVMALFAKVDDPYLLSRRDDLEQTLARVYAALRRGDAATPRRTPGTSTVLIAQTLSPAELLHAHEQGLAGIVQAGGSPHAHAAILARSLKLPLVVQLTRAFTGVRDGEMVLVDGDAGQLITAPDAFDLQRLRACQVERERAERRRAGLRRADTRTADRVPIELHANAEASEDVNLARRLGANGIGLFRSEILYLRGEAPDERDQFRAYRDAVLAMAGRPVVLRTLDLSADEVRDDGHARPPEENPALGLRGIRLSLADRDRFAAQLRAMLRASAYGPVRILLPMLSLASEARAARELLAHCRAELGAEGVALGEEVPLGGMIETPAAAIDCRNLLRELDFVAIGSNDLTQYTLAVDRNHAELSAAYDPLHPAVLRLIAETVAAARRARKPLLLCGELANDIQALPLLLALGITAFSVRPSAILDLREALLALDCQALRKRRAQFLAARDQTELLRLIASAT